MSKKIIKYIISIAIIIIIISIITIVYSYSNKTPEVDVYQKIDEEISYVDRRVLELMKMLNNLDIEYMITNNVINATGENTSSDSTKSDTDTESSKQASEGESGTDKSSQADGGEESNGKQGNSITISTKESQSILLRDRNDINWTYIQTELENLINSWSVITIDLKSINTNNDDILAFNTNAETALKYVQEKNKSNALISLSNLYGLLPKYAEKCNKDFKDLEILYIKYDVLVAYALIETNQWDKISTFLGDADNRNLRLINSDNAEVKNNQNIQKSYILLKEFIKSANEKNVDMCYMKFYYLIDELEKI
jgi:hypothetical protein